MPTHAELTAKLLTDASAFFKTLGEQNEPLKEQMDENADVFEQLAGILAQDPQMDVNGTPVNEMAGRLMKDAATFFLTLAEQNEGLREQMTENATVYEQLGELVAKDPLGVME